MASDYGIITIADLEAFATRDYSSYTDSEGNSLYSDTNIEAWISQAETLVNKVCQQTFDSTAGKDIKNCVKYVARQFANIQLVEDGILSAERAQILDRDELIKYIESVVGNEQTEGQIKEVEGVDDWE